MRALLAIVIFAGSAASLFADGGIILKRESVNGLDVTVFAAPAPLRAGPTDFSVLIQKPGGDPVLDARVQVAWSSATNAFPEWMPPCCRMQGADSLPAIRAHSKNKMLYSAILPIRTSGSSRLLVNIEQDGKTSSIPCEIIAAHALPPWQAYWPCLAFPPLAIIGFALHQNLSASRRPKGAIDSADRE